MISHEGVVLVACMGLALVFAADYKNSLLEVRSQVNGTPCSTNLTQNITCKSRMSYDLMGREGDNYLRALTALYKSEFVNTARYYLPKGTVEAISHLPSVPHSRPSTHPSISGPVRLPRAVASSSTTARPRRPSQRPRPFTFRPRRPRRPKGPRFHPTTSTRTPWPRRPKGPRFHPITSTRTPRIRGRKSWPPRPRPRVFPPIQWPPWLLGTHRPAVFPIPILPIVPIFPIPG